MKKRKNYDEDFKKDAVRLYQNNGDSLRETARRLGVAQASLAEWTTKYSPEVKGEVPSGELQLSYDERAELERLRKEVEVLREEKVILKKAAAFFAKESK